MNRLRYGDWLTGIAAVVLFGALFLDWFGVASGWSSLGWAALVFCVLAVIAGLALLLVAGQDSPVLPVLTSILATMFGLLSVVALLVQVVAQPGPDEVVGVKAGWWLGLVASFGIAAGGWLAMRDERTPNARDRPVEVRPAPPVA